MTRTSANGGAARGFSDGLPSRLNCLNTRQPTLPVTTTRDLDQAGVRVVFFLAELSFLPIGDGLNDGDQMVSRGRTSRTMGGRSVNRWGRRGAEESELRSEMRQRVEDRG